MGTMATIHGTSGNDRIYGTQGNDTLRGRGGDDYLNGQGGDDTIGGGADNDKVDGGAGNDTVRGGDGNDFVAGGAGNDRMFGDAGDDYLWDEAGDDRLFGGSGNDRLVGAEGRNSLSGEAGDDTLVALRRGEVRGDTASVFSGGAGRDTLHGNVDALIDIDPDFTPPLVADATLRVDFSFSEAEIGSGVFGYGSRYENPTEGPYQFFRGGTFSGIERITVEPDTALEYHGGTGNVTAVGSDRHDFFYDGSGDETFVGGGGDDLFHFGWGGSDRIVGFNAAEGDLISFRWGPGGAYSSPPIDIEMVERNGHTIMTSIRPDGTVRHTLDVDAVGIPADSIMSDWIWS
jgi:Ca2+-binding RTX toxin-like protein